MRFFLLALSLVPLSLVAWSAQASESPPEEKILSELHENFLLSEELLSKFDAAVDRGKTILDLIQANPREENLYAKLLVLRASHDQLESDLNQRLEFLLANEGLKNSSVLESRFTGLILTLKAKHKKSAESLEISSNFALGAVLNSGQGGSDLAALRAWRKKFRARGSRADLERSVSAMRAEVEAAASSLQSVLFQGLELEPSGANSDLKVFPSVGSAGNVTGSNFPKGVWSLTFDDGPGRTTDKVIENLKSHDLRASFFVLSMQLEKSSFYRSLALKELQEGHDVFSHSYHHLQINRLADPDQKHEIEDAIQYFTSVIGHRPGFFRLPYGAGVSAKKVRAELVRSCVVHVFWNVDTLDWHDRDPDSIYQRSVKQMKTLGRGIILFHDIHPQSVSASEQVMSYLKSNDLQVKPVSSVVDQLNDGQKWTCQPSW